MAEHATSASRDSLASARRDVHRANATDAELSMPNKCATERTACASVGRALAVDSATNAFPAISASPTVRNATAMAMRTNARQRRAFALTAFTTRKANIASFAPMDITETPSLVPPITNVRLVRVPMDPTLDDSLHPHAARKTP